MEFYAWRSGEGVLDDRVEDASSKADATEPLHELREPPLIFVLVTVADPHATGVAPQACGDEQKPESRGSQCSVP